MTIEQYELATPIMEEIKKVEEKITALDSFPNSPSVELAMGSTVVQLSSFEYSTLKVKEAVLEILCKRKHSLLDKLKAI